MEIRHLQSIAGTPAEIGNLLRADINRLQSKSIWGVWHNAQLDEGPLEKARERLQAAASYSYDWDAVGNVLPVDCIDYLEGLRYKNTGFYEVIVQID